MNELNYPKYTDNADISVINENFKAVATAIQASEAHEASKQNPHGVTKEQLGLGNVLNVKQASKAEVDILATTKSEVVFGTYEYNILSLSDTFNTETRICEVFINLNFRPKAVEIYAVTGEQNYYNSMLTMRGGLALDGFPCTNTVGTSDANNVAKQVTVNNIEIADNGFYIRDALTYVNQWTGKTSMIHGLHYFKAYKIGNIVNVGDTNGN